LKKAIKIICIIIAAIVSATIISAAVIVVFFPGLPCYIKIKMSYKNIDNTLHDFEYYDICDYNNKQLITVGNINMYIPQDCQISMDNEAGIVYENTETGYSAGIFKRCNDDRDIAESVTANASYKDRLWYNKNFGGCPKNGFEFFKILFSLNSGYFDITSKDNTDFMTLADQKEWTLPDMKYYYYESSNIKGFIFESDKDKVSMVFQFYSVNDLNIMYQIFVSSKNDNSLVYSSINSITITDNKQNP